jgi:peptidyl-prolyl cis-trans isomerase C
MTGEEEFRMPARSVLRSLASKRLVASTMLVAALSATAVLATPLTERSEPAADPVIARVNDIEIRESDVRAADKEMGRNLPIRADTRREEVIRFLTDTVIISAAAGETVLNEAEIRSRTAFVRNRVIMEQVIEAVGRQAASEQAVRKAYDEMVAKITIEPEYHLYELYFPVVDRNDEAATKAAEEKARTAYERIAKGEAFEAVVREMSDNPSAKANGGNRGYLLTAVMGKEFAEVAPTLEKGKTSRPFKTQAGWHLIKIEDTRMRTPPDLASSRSGLEFNLAGRARSDFLNRLRSEAKVQRLDNVSAGSSATPGK